MKKKYDYLIVGAGLFGCVFAERAKSKGKRCLVVDCRKHTGGNVYCENIEGINVHKYGAHIFHTDNQEVWNYVNRFVEFNNYINSPIANYKNKLYNLPFNMNTFYQIWGVTAPDEAMQIIQKQTAKENVSKPKNLEEKALSLVGRDIYETLIKGYTEKQWGRSAKELPAFIINRLPLRFTYDNNYFNDRFQGIPMGGYNSLIGKLLEGTEVQLETEFISDKKLLSGIADIIIYTGAIDQYYNYCFGELDYRSLSFEHEILDIENYQGVAVMNYTEFEIPYTRIIEHKHFENIKSNKTIITKEFPALWTRGKEMYYPLNNSKNNALYYEYLSLTEKTGNIHFAGRLGEYKYYDMDDTIEKAISLSELLL